MRSPHIRQRIDAAKFDMSIDVLRGLVWSHLRQQARWREQHGVEPGSRHVRDANYPNQIKWLMVPPDFNVKVPGVYLKAWFGPDAERHGNDAQHRLAEVAHEFVRAGILRQDHDVPAQFFLTRQAMLVMDRTESIVPVTAGTERAVALGLKHANFPGISTIERHYSEAIACFTSGLTLAGTVMIGVCFEAVEESLAAAVVDADTRHSLDLDRRSRHAIKRIKDDRFVGAQELARLVDNAVVAMDLERRNRLLHQWAIETRGPAITFIRERRNHAGHPTGKPVSHADLMVKILLLDDHIAKADRLRLWLLSHEYGGHQGDSP